ncbi:hypothetical protein TNCV_3780411 [Trichonephila clavipes]|nr:hypothetical protein TNCV_3780411 [Trichonephila clavipes]
MRTTPELAHPTPKYSFLTNGRILSLVRFIVLWSPSYSASSVAAELKPTTREPRVFDHKLLDYPLHQSFDKQPKTENSEEKQKRTVVTRKATAIRSIAESPLMRWMEGKESSEALDPPGCSPSKWGGTDLNRTVNCMVLKAKPRLTTGEYLALCQDEFRGPGSDTVEIRRHKKQLEKSLMEGKSPNLIFMQSLLVVDNDSFLKAPVGGQPTLVEGIMRVDWKTIHHDDAYLSCLSRLNVPMCQSSDKLDIALI